MHFAIAIDNFPLIMYLSFVSCSVRLTPVNEKCFLLALRQVRLYDRSLLVLHRAVQLLSYRAEQLLSYRTEQLLSYRAVQLLSYRTVRCHPAMFSDTAANFCRRRKNSNIPTSGSPQHSQGEISSSPRQLSHLAFPPVLLAHRLKPPSSPVRLASQPIVTRALF